MQLRQYIFRIRQYGEWKNMADVTAGNLPDAWAELQRILPWIEVVERPRHASSMIKCLSRQNVIYITRGQMLEIRQPEFDFNKKPA